MSVERFECVRRAGRHVALAVCAVDYRIANAHAGPVAVSCVCTGCAVGAQHAQLKPARAWPGGDRVRWIGERPPELVEQPRERPKPRASLSYGQCIVEASVIIEVRR